jgi:hypothetical protein
MGFLDGTTTAPPAMITIPTSDGKSNTEAPNPDYDSWVQTDHQVLHTY